MKHVISSIAVLILLCSFYFSINPTNSYLIPKCPFHLLTGLDCPACGIQRALHYFLHGEWGTAIKYNYFLIISVPYFCTVAFTTFSKNTHILFAKRIVQHPTTVKIFLSLTILWWVIRNIPPIKEIFGLL